MTYIKPSNTRYLQDRIKSLDALADVANSSTGDDAIRNSILAKIEQYRSDELARYSETKLPDGSVRIHHPGIGVVSVDHSVLPKPTDMFGNPTKSLTAYTITVSRADAIVTPEGLISYEPNEVVGQFKLSELSYNQMVANPSCGDFPVTIEKLKGFKIEPTIDSAFTSKPRHLANAIQKTVLQMSSQLSDLTGQLEAMHLKGGKLSQKVIDDLVRSEVPDARNFAGRLSHGIKKVAEFSQEVTTAQRIEIEAFISASKTKGDK